MQTKLTEENAKKLDYAADIISQAFTWGDTDEGHEYWDEVCEHLMMKASNRTSDGKPYVEPEPPIPEGYRKANADEWTRTDVKHWDNFFKEWRPRMNQGTAFDPSYCGTRYIIPIDPPLTDKDACVWPRLLVMVRDDDKQEWKGPVCYFGKDDDSDWPFVVFFPDRGSEAYAQARRATPEEIEAAK